MSARTTFVMMLVVATWASAAPWPPPPHEVQAPLQYVTISGPAGLQVTFLEGKKERTFEAPVTVGLRPAYVYRLRLSNLKDHPGVSLYPSLDVCGTLRLPSTLSAATFPTPVHFSEDDVERALAGVMVTKTLLLEDADKWGRAQPLEGQPAQLDVSADEDPIKAAAKLGRPVLIARLGVREPSAAELACIGSGNVLYPGMASLPPATSTPLRRPAIDPRFRGPWDPPEEILRDGGDQGRGVFIGPGGTLEGLDASDSVAEYRNTRGQLRLAISNTVCVVVPRFIALRQLTPSFIYEEAKNLADVVSMDERRELMKKSQAKPVVAVEDSPTLKAQQRLQGYKVATPPAAIIEVQPLLAYEVDVGPAALLGSERIRLIREEERARLAKQVELAIFLSRLLGPQRIDHELGTKAVGTIEGAGQITGSLETREIVYLCIQEKPELPEQPLCLLKWASATHAQVGDTLTFFIRYTNQGGKPIRDIAVSDSLAGRLEYVPGSARSDREAVFVTQRNEVGSVVLRWEIRDPLPPGKQGVVSFQAKVK